MCAVTFGRLDRLLVPIATSLGGLVAKQWLLNVSENAKGSTAEAERSKQLLEHLPGLVFLAVPHLGAAAAKSASKMPASSPFLQVLEPSTCTAELAALNACFIQQVLVKFDIDILNIYETCNTMVVSLLAAALLKQRAFHQIHCILQCNWK